MKTETSKTGTSHWIDITRPMDDTLVTWPGRARPSRRWEKQIAAGHHCNVSFWELRAHSGTHMDAPLHFIEDGSAIDQIPPATFIGGCRVVDLTALHAPLDEARARLYAGQERLLFKTQQSSAKPEYAPHAALLTPAAAAVLLANGLLLIGMDRLSVDDSQSKSFALHRALLGAGCVILEGLLLDDVAEGDYELHAAPLRFTGAEASPVRALLRIGSR